MSRDEHIIPQELIAEPRTQISDISLEVSHHSLINRRAVVEQLKDHNKNKPNFAHFTCNLYQVMEIKHDLLMFFLIFVGRSKSTSRR
jgi:hypothetical protein